MKQLTVRAILAAHLLLASAKITKMDDADKFKVIKTLRAMKPIVAEFEEARNTALEKLKGEEHDEMVALAQQWQREGEATTLTEERRIAVNTYLAKYNADVAKCIDETMNEKHGLDTPTLTGEAFAKLTASNDWTVEQCVELMDVMCD